MTIYYTEKEKEHMGLREWRFQAAMALLRACEDCASDARILELARKCESLAANAEAMNISHAKRMIPDAVLVCG